MSLESAHALVRRVADDLGLTSSQVEALLRTDAEHQFEVALKNGSVHKAYRVQHNNRRGPYKGGIRFHPTVHLEEVKELALLMTLKTAALNLPLGGGKGGVTVDPRQLSDEELEELSRAYAAQLIPHIGPDKDVPAPDVNTDARVIDWMTDEYAKHTGDTSGAAFTGKSVEHGGSEGREVATGRGGVAALREVLGRVGWNDSVKLAVQGFGNVGSFFATVATAEQPEWEFIAASDTSATIIDPTGLKATELSRYKTGGGRFSDYSDVTTRRSPEEIISEPVDVLVLAALGDVVTEANMHKVKAKIILELANGPVNENAYRYLSEQGVIIVPDILANSGGVIVSYLEWVQNKRREHWSAQQVSDELARYMASAIDEVWNFSQKQGVPMKEAAVAIALQRLTNKQKPA